MTGPTLFVGEPFASLWSGLDPFVAVEALKGEVFRELEARRTLRIEVAGQGYFVKIHRGVGWKEILKNLLSLRLPVLGAGNEWRASRLAWALSWASRSASVAAIRRRSIRSS